jgi:hypothetical protein
MSVPATSFFSTALRSSSGQLPQVAANEIEHVEGDQHARVDTAQLVLQD